MSGLFALMALLVCIGKFQSKVVPFIFGTYFIIHFIYLTIEWQNEYVIFTAWIIGTILERTPDPHSCLEMLTEYPYGSIRNTGALHVLVAMGLFGANGHAYLKIHNTLGIVNFLEFLPINWNVHTYFFAPLFAVGVYITILGSVGGAAGSRSYNKAVVNNFKMFYLVVNAMSAFLISWFAAIDIYCIFLMNGSTLDLFGIRINIYASFGLMLFELLLAIFSILLCCLSGYPDGTRKNETIPLSAITHQPPVQIPPHNQGYAYDPNMATGYANNGWTR